MKLDDARRERLKAAALATLADALNDNNTSNRVKAALALLLKLEDTPLAAEGEVLNVTVVYSSQPLPIADGTPAAAEDADSARAAFAARGEVQPGETRPLFEDLPASRCRTDDADVICPGWSDWARLYR